MATDLFPTRERGGETPLPLAKQLRPPIHRPVWSPSGDAVLIVSQGLGDEHALLVPIAVAETMNGFQTAWDQKPVRVQLTGLDDALRNHTVSVGGASDLATHYWVLIWSSWVPPDGLISRKPFRLPLETTAPQPVVLETQALEAALLTLWRPDHPGLLTARRRP